MEKGQKGYPIKVYGYNAFVTNIRGPAKGEEFGWVVEISFIPSQPNLPLKGLERITINVRPLHMAKLIEESDFGRKKLADYLSNEAEVWLAFLARDEFEMREGLAVTASQAGKMLGLEQADSA